MASAAPQPHNWSYQAIPAAFMLGIVPHGCMYPARQIKKHELRRSRLHCPSNGRDKKPDVKCDVRLFHLLLGVVDSDTAAGHGQTSKAGRVGSQLKSGIS